MYQLTNRVGQALLIDKKKPKKVLTRDQDNWDLNLLEETEYIVVYYSVNN